jgi:DNA-binding protein WhiA
MNQSFSDRVKYEISLSNRLRSSDKIYIKSTFIKCGSINDPSKNYHFEFVCNSQDEVDEIIKHINAFGVRMHTVMRGGKHILYCKDSESIMTLLSCMGAKLAMMQFENVRIEKEINNSVNRQVNCDTANQQKIARTSVQQIEDILLIKNTMGLASLPKKLEELCMARLTYPEAPLAELGNYMSPKIGKSGVNHRLKKIIAIAEDCRVAGTSFCAER